MSKRPPKRNATRREGPSSSSGDVSALRRDPWCAAALDSGVPIEDVRAAYAARNPSDPIDRLATIARDLRSLEDRRRALVLERSELVLELRSAGVPWHRLVEASGVSRPTLIQAVNPRA